MNTVPSTISEQIQHTRSKLQERFSSFEQSLLRELSIPVAFPETSEPDAQTEIDIKSAEPLPTALPSATGNDMGAQLKKTIEQQQSEIRSLERSNDNLRNSLKEMGTERQRLIQELNHSEKPANLPSNFSEIQAENIQLKNKMERIFKHRQKSARFWRQRVDFFRAHKKMAEKNQVQKEASATELSKVTNELDSALELIAELRDELHFARQLKPAPPRTQEHGSNE